MKMVKRGDLIVVRTSDNGSGKGPLIVYEYIPYGIRSTVILLIFSGKCIIGPIGKRIIDSGSSTSG